MKRMWTVLMPCSVALFGTLMGCYGGMNRINLPEQQRAELFRLPEIQTVHWLQERGFIVMFPNWGIHNKRIGVHDPIAIVQQHLVAQLTAELGFTNIESVEHPLWWPGMVGIIRPCCIRDGLTELQHAFGNGFVLDLASNEAFLTNMDPDRTYFFFQERVLPDNLDPFRSGAFDFIHNLYYRARARLIRLEDRAVLWQGLCSVASYTSKSEWKREIDWELPVLEEQLAVAAMKCAHQFIEQLQDRGPTPSVF